MKTHHESHRTQRMGWLRAAVLGANDGLISTASLVMGMSAAHIASPVVFMAALAGMVGGALSMAAGEYVSVSSQADSERADLARERRELEASPEAERRELMGIYLSRGLSRETAERVAIELTAHDALAAHARDELGITEQNRARPALAAGASALSFATGAAVPLALLAVLPELHRSALTFGLSLVLLVALGALGGSLGGARMLPAAIRVGFWGVVAMGMTALIGRMAGAGIT